LLATAWNTMKRPGFLLSLALLLAVVAGPASALTAEDVNEAVFKEEKRADAGKPDPFIVKAQVLLSRRSISPGEVDGIDGENYRKAIAQFRRQEKLGDGDELDEAAWRALSDEEGAGIVTEYVLSKQDVSEDFPDRIPDDYAKQAKMKRLFYTGAEEMLAERFHMSEKLLRALNVTPRATQALLGSVPFTVTGVPLAEDAALIEAGLDLSLAEATTLGFAYAGQFGDGTTQNSVNATLKVSF
jgi:peptidoglycan hydrolase-like protein with peptidoglycan-binding domain